MDAGAFATFSAQADEAFTTLTSPGAAVGQREALRWLDAQYKHNPAGLWQVCIDLLERDGADGSKRLVASSALNRLAMKERCNHMEDWGRLMALVARADETKQARSQLALAFGALAIRANEEQPLRNTIEQLCHGLSPMVLLSVITILPDQTEARRMGGINKTRRDHIQIALTQSADLVIAAARLALTASSPPFSPQHAAPMTHDPQTMASVFHCLEVWLTHDHMNAMLLELQPFVSLAISQFGETMDEARDDHVSDFLVAVASVDSKSNRAGEPVLLDVFAMAGDSALHVITAAASSPHGHGVCHRVCTVAQAVVRGYFGSPSSCGVRTETAVATAGMWLQLLMRTTHCNWDDVSCDTFGLWEDLIAAWAVGTDEPVADFGNLSMSTDGGEGGVGAVGGGGPSRMGGGAAAGWAAVLQQAVEPAVGELADALVQRARMREEMVMGETERAEECADMAEALTDYRKLHRSLLRKVTARSRRHHVEFICHCCRQMMRVREIPTSPGLDSQQEVQYQQHARYVLWSETEAWLHALTVAVKDCHGMGEAVDTALATMLGWLVGKGARLRELHRQVTIMAVVMLGQMSEWLKAHPEWLPAALQIVAQGYGLSEYHQIFPALSKWGATEHVSSVALLKWRVCAAEIAASDECTVALAACTSAAGCLPESPADGEGLVSCDSACLSLQMVAKVVSHAHFDRGLQLLVELCEPAYKRIQHGIEERGRGAAHPPTGMIDALKKLSVICSAVECTDGQAPLTAGWLQERFGVLQTAASAYPADETVAGPVISMVRGVVQNTPPSSLAAVRLTDSGLGCVLAAFEANPLVSHMENARKIIASAPLCPFEWPQPPGEDVHQATARRQARHLIDAGLQCISQGPFDNNPDLVVAVFALAMDVVVRCPTSMVEEDGVQVWDRVLAGAVSGLTLQHKDAGRMVLKLLNVAVEMPTCLNALEGSGRHAAGKTIKLHVQQAGPALCHGLLRGSAGGMPSWMLETVCKTLKNVLDTHGGLVFNEWMVAALEPKGFPTRNCSDEGKVRFRADLLASRADPRLFKRIVKSFTGGKRRGEKREST